MDFEVRRKEPDGAVEEELIATAHFVLVAVRRDTLDPIPVPDDLGGVSEEDCARPLKSGDFFSLGPSNVNLFLFFQKS